MKKCTDNWGNLGLFFAKISISIFLNKKKIVQSRRGPTRSFEALTNI
jgi:hypothetical protein